MFVPQRTWICYIPALFLTVIKYTTLNTSFPHNHTLLFTYLSVIHTQQTMDTDDLSLRATYVHEFGDVQKIEQQTQQETKLNELTRDSTNEYNKPYIEAGSQELVLVAEESDRMFTLVELDSEVNLGYKHGMPLEQMSTPLRDVNDSKLSFPAKTIQSVLFYNGDFTPAMYLDIKFIDQSVRSFQLHCDQAVKINKAEALKQSISVTDDITETYPCTRQSSTTLISTRPVLGVMQNL